jgi:hypothetical protein
MDFLNRWPRARAIVMTRMILFPVAACVILGAGGAWIAMSNRDPEWKVHANEVWTLTQKTLENPGKLPPDFLATLRQCNQDLLQRERWTSVECDLLFAILDENLAKSARHKEGTTEEMWPRLHASCAISTIQERFRLGAPIEPEVVDRIHAKFLDLMKHKSWRMRLSVVTGALYARMDSNQKLAAQLIALKNDPEPLVASVCRRFEQNSSSSEYVKARDEAVQLRGY